MSHHILGAGVGCEGRKLARNAERGHYLCFEVFLWSRLECRRQKAEGGKAECRRRKGYGTYLPDMRGFFPMKIFGVDKSRRHRARIQRANEPGAWEETV
ncbi:MAG: hypothetical protein HQP61_10830 [Peptococcaceae bacterium]|nr:hypothetical protein [Candidatus Syntrophopropionicum ammoniitolerans]